MNINAPVIKMIDTDDYQWAPPIATFFQNQVNDLPPDQKKWMAARTEDDFHALISGKDGGRIWVATTAGGAGEIIRGMVAFSKGRIQFSPTQDQNDNIGDNDLRASFSAAARAGNIGLVQCLLTDEIYRGNGLGSQLIQHALDHARTNDIPIIGAIVAKENIQSLSSFLKTGAQIIGENTRESDGTERYVIGFQISTPPLDPRG